MKTNMKRLLGLILALSMVMSLLSVNVWAADTSADGSGDPAVSSTEPQEAEPEEAAPEGNAEEAAPEGEPEEAAPEGEAAQPEEAETKPKEEQPKPKMKAKKQQTMSLTAQDYDPYASLKNTKTVITFDGKSWYLADYDADTVTLLAKECVGASKYNESGSFVEYSNDPPPTVKTAVDNWYNVNITADAQTAVSGNAMLLLTKSQADALSTEALKCSQASGAVYNYWWLCSQVGDSDYAVVVDGDSGDVNGYGYSVGGTLGVRPALKLDLSKVTFDSTSNTFSVAHLDPVSYLAWDDTQKKLVEKKGDDACKTYTVVSNQTAWGTAGTETWYVVNTPSTENLTISNRITVSGEVNLILLDGAKLTGSKGITTTGATLNIYEGWTGDSRAETPTVGELVATGNSNNNAGIGGIGSSSGNGGTGGNVTIHGGTLSAKGATGAAGIGGGYGDGTGGSGGSVTIYGGTVTATGGGFGSAGIGGGFAGSAGGSGGSVTIHGGTVTANGGPTGSGVGIGGGYAADGTGGNGATVTINGGTVTANGGDGAKGIGGGGGNNPGTPGDLILGEGVTLQTSANNNIWAVYESTRAQYMRTAPDPVSYQAATWNDTSKKVTYTESANTTYTVVTNQTTWGAADAESWYVVNGTPTISNRITVKGTVNLILCDGAKLTASKGITTTNATLNIYEGWTGDRAETHTVGELVATGAANYNAGIGGLGSEEYDGGAGGTVNIHGGTVTATGHNVTGSGGAGIGGGFSEARTGGAGGTVTIYSGTVTATGGYKAAGIGGGDGATGGAGGSVTIYGGTVTATGKSGGAGIGGGSNASDNGTLTLGRGVTMYGDDSPLSDPPAEDKKIESTVGENVTTRYRYMKNTYDPHTHDFTYSASGATITATCAATDCDLPVVNTKPTATLTINAPEHTAVGDGKSAEATLTDLNGIQGKAAVSYYNTSGGNKTGNALSAAPEGEGTYWAEITLTNEVSGSTATAHVVYTVANPAYTITLPTGLEHGTVTADKTKAKYGEEVALTVTPESDEYICRTLTVTDADSGDVTVTDNKFTMPASPVTVAAAFGQKTSAAVALTVNTVSGKGGTACLMDEDFAPLSENEQVREGEEFILCVDPEEEYNFTLALAPDAEKEEFSADDYKDYLEYVDEHNENAAPNEQITISPDTVMYWVTMPRVTSGNLSATVTFIAPKTYTVLYQPTASTEAVFCKLSTAQDGTNVKYGLMNKGAKMGDNTVWSMTVTSANEPKQIAFAEANQPKDDAETAALMTALQGAAMTDISGIRTSENWTTLANNGKYCVFGGNAKVVTAIFVSDANAAATDDEYSLDNAEVTGVEAYQFAVCPTDSSGKVTDFASVTAPAAPAAPTGKAFAGWRGFQFDSIDAKATDHDYSAGATIKVRENTVFNAAWKPQTLKVKRNLNGGTGESGDISVQYQEKASISVPTRSGYAFDGWTVSEAVTEDGVYYAKGSVFDTETRITANLKLTAQWKHVHSYSCYQISAFGDALKDYQKYGTSIHVALCGCNDVKLMAHEFDSNGKCKCGYQKPQPAEVTMNVSYGQWSGGNYTEKAQDLPETVKRNQEVEVWAPGYWGDLQFSKWQYSTDNGTTWDDLTADAYASFLIPCSLKVRALYVNPVTIPQVELISRQYDDHAVVNGTTYTMDNILYQMNYKLPDGCTFVDGGIKLGDNSGISYYFIQQVRMSYDNESKGIIAGLGAGLAAATVFTDGIFAAAQTFNDVAGHMNDTGITYNYLETEKDVTSEKMDKATLAKYMYEGKPVNVEKYPPIYWVANVPTKGMSGSIATAPPLRFAQKNNQEHYIYGIAWMRYKDSSGKTKTIYTDAITPTANHPAASISKSGS